MFSKGSQVRKSPIKWIMIYVIKFVWSRVHDLIMNGSRGMSIFGLLITKWWSDHDLIMIWITSHQL
jgi:hypothetical protein